MNKILTVPKEIHNDSRVLYAGNHYISIPAISSADASIRSFNIISMFNKGLVELAGEEAFLSLELYKGDRPLDVESVKTEIELNYILVSH